MTQAEIWMFADTTWVEVDLTGFDVEARDGKLGTVESTSHEVGANDVVVETGGLLRSKKLLIPAGLISKVDFGERRLFIDRPKEEIEEAPEFDEENYKDIAYREDLGGYYFARDHGGPVT